MKILVTGASGLVGSEAVNYYCSNGHLVYGIDNDMRQHFFGKNASTKKINELMKLNYRNYRHFNIDIRSKKIESVFSEFGPFQIIIHAAAQPSHDWAKEDPITDFTINANGTQNLLENFRKHCKNAVFIFTSTNKVYGDLPNSLPIIEKETRYEISKEHPYFNGISETMSIDMSKHSLFGASKLAADIMVQEYGRYFGLYTGVFRCGCITGKAHAGAKLHGFLSFLVKTIMAGQEYVINGYKGKQVRDNIHAYDLITALNEFSKSPKKGEVYNMGGSRHSNISILEAISIIEKISRRKANVRLLDKPRDGDHIWYISDVGKFRNDFPNWTYKYNTEDIIKELILENS